MRTYQEHLEFLKNLSFAKNKTKITRSSAIFPIFYDRWINTRLLFLGYWKIKRKVTDIQSVITLRNSNGNILTKKTQAIDKAKAYQISIEDLFPLKKPFKGTCEIEFFSSFDLVFPYPAVVVNYFGKNFCSVVHSAQRTYNDRLDQKINSQVIVPESGFNIYSDKDKEPFLTFINGPKKLSNNTLTLIFYNHKNRFKSVEIPIKSLKEYEQIIIYPKKLFSLDTFLEGKEGTVKALFPVDSIFPRIIAGNISNQTPAINVTHSYYDCSSQKGEKHLWVKKDPKWHSATLAVPLHPKETHITFYPIYSSSFFVSIQFYDQEGNLLKEKNNLFQIHPNTFKRFSINRFIEQKIIKKGVVAKIIANSSLSSPIPSRIKIGLDLGSFLPCNICTNLLPFQKELDKKLSCFRWVPFFADNDHPFCFITNSSPYIQYQREAEVLLTFYRDSDEKILEKKIIIPPNGFHKIEKTKEIQSFFQKKPGWITVKSNNPYINTFYFIESSKGIIGGDHGF